MILKIKKKKANNPIRKIQCKVRAGENYFLFWKLMSWFSITPCRWHPDTHLTTPPFSSCTHILHQKQALSLTPPLSMTLPCQRQGGEEEIHEPITNPGPGSAWVRGLPKVGKRRPFWIQGQACRCPPRRPAGLCAGPLSRLLGPAPPWVALQVQLRGFLHPFLTINEDKPFPPPRVDLPLKRSLIWTTI